ncbi:hypothetical protein [Streptomyces sp. DH41]|uniref:hypothetical protein n=1 Tax=Streptomyces sp. DH41 TaxID=3040125 RepID=UPI0024434FF9|nr:hypothetical protein [Streptomyces sp. DH41]MDG9727621.1 hypothetical protein [Streptomyces sp. DH41]
MRGWPGEVSHRVAIGYGALAGLVTAFGATFSLLCFDGLSWALALTWVLLLAAGPALATLLFSRPVAGRRPVRAVGQGLISVVGQVVWAAPFSIVISLVAQSGSPFWPLLVIWLLNGGYCAFWATHVSTELPARAAGRTNRHAPSPRTAPAVPVSSAPRSAREEQATTEFCALLSAHPFDASLPGVAYPEVADHSLALDAYDRAKDASAGEVRGILAEGRAALARLDARMGLDTVHPGSGCFFDHRHGPAVVSVEWSPRGGTSRRVEVCRADAVRLADERPRP